MTKTISITANVTPNPNTLKFLVNTEVIGKGTCNFESSETAHKSKLPKALFGIEGISGVMVGTNFVSVTKEATTDWTSVAQPITTTLKTVLAEEGPYVDPDLVATLPDSEEDSEIVKRIKEILDSEIRPAVAMDGGDVQFESFEDGIVALKLHGACSSCPSSVMTLKMGIENRLKEDIPEIEEVIQV